MKFTAQRLVGVLALLGSTVALADPVSVTFGPDASLFRYNPGVVVDLDETTMNANARFQTVSSAPILATQRVGEFNVTVTDAAGVDSQLYAFCIEVDQNISQGAALDTYQRNLLSAPATVDNGAGVVRTGRDDAFADSLRFGQLNSLYNQFAHLADDSAILAAAFQIALWEVRYDGGSVGAGLNLDGGDFVLAADDAGYAGGDADAQQARDVAANWIGDLVDEAITPGREYVLLTSNDFALNEWQDLIGITPDVRVPPAAPAPGTLALLGIGALAFARRRK
jgi:hypothetical protein